jgi:hypothetical protein
VSQTCIICGDRNWSYGETIATVLSVAPKWLIVVNGDALGADYLASLVWRSEYGGHTIEVPADWDKYGRAAGPIRNKAMLAYRPQFVLGFHEHMERSRGTRSMFNLAQRENIPTYLVTQTWLERERLAASLSRFKTSGLEGMVSLMTALRSWRQGNLTL